MQLYEFPVILGSALFCFELARGGVWAGITWSGWVLALYFLLLLLLLLALPRWPRDDDK